MPSTLEVLSAIYDQVKNKDNWCQGALCKKDTDQYCLVGRLYAINDFDKKEEARQRLYEVLAELKQPLDIAAYNDSHTHEEVVQLVVRAISIEKRSISGNEKFNSMMRIS